MAKNTASESGAARSGRIVRFALFLVGGLLAAYALSDHPLYGGAPGFGKVQALLLAGGVAVFLCGFLPRRFADGILVFTVTGLAMLGVAELVGEMILGPRYRGIYTLDDRVIFKLIPDRTSVLTRAPINGGETVTQRINSDGFRGPELRSDHSTRVVVYGDSFIHAAYSDWEDTFSGQLQRILSEKSGRDIEVINAGVSSYGPDQIALKMEAELPRLKPDIVIVSVFAGNDFGDLLRNKLFRIDDEGAIRLNPHWRLTEELAARWELAQRESILKRALSDALSTVRALIASQSSDGPASIPDFINLDFLVEQAEREYRDFVEEKSDLITNTHIDYYSANVNLTPRSDSARFQSEYMRQILARIDATAKDAGVPLVFLFIPHPFDVAENYDEWQLDQSRYPDYDSRNQIRVLEKAAASLKTPYLSLYEPYRATDANKLYFHGGDDHWNRHGQLLAAQLMVRRLHAIGLLAH